MFLPLFPRSQCFKRWIALSTGQNTIQWLSVWKSIALSFEQLGPNKMHLSHWQPHPSNRFLRWSRDQARTGSPLDDKGEKLIEILKTRWLLSLHKSNTRWRVQCSPREFNSWRTPEQIESVGNNYRMKLGKNKLTINRRRDIPNLFISGNSFYNPSHSWFKFDHNAFDYT